MNCYYTRNQFSGELRVCELVTLDNFYRKREQINGKQIKGTKELTYDQAYLPAVRLKRYYLKITNDLTKLFFFLR